MDELIKQITEKTGLDAGKAKQVVGTVAGFLSDKLPAPIAGQVTKLLGGGGDSSGDGGDDGGDLMDKAKGALGGLLGG